MDLYISLSSRAKFLKIALFICFTFFLSNLAEAQAPPKKDYIVILDSIYSQGNVKELPESENQVVYFARTRREGFKKYTIEEVTELRVAGRVFFSKTFELNGEKKLAFLEQLTGPAEKVTIWKWNGKPRYYFLETESGIRQLLDSDYQSQLNEAYGNPDLEPLIELTKLNDLSLIYLAQSSKKVQKPRTFTNLFAITPFVGYSSQTIGYTIPDTNLEEEMTGSSFAAGINAEAFVTFKRNLSINVGATYSRFDSQEYLNFNYGGYEFQNDVFADFHLIQFPALARYYLDLKPNKMRLYGEVGYTYAIPIYNSMGIYQAKFERNEVETSTRSFEMEDSFSGLVWGIGLEKYLNKNHGLVVGLRQFNGQADLSDFVRGLTFHLGYKF